MATAAAMRAYLRDVIGVQDPITRRQAIQDEGLEVITDFAEFDKKDIQTLCASVRKPGGTIPNPNAAAANQPANIPNPGYSIAAIWEKRMIAAAYAAKTYQMIGRPVTSDAMNRDRLKLFEDHRTLIENHEDPEKLPQVSKSFGIIKAMDMIPGHLRERLGVNKVALSYIIRKDVAVPALQAQENNSITGADYPSLMDELIARAPHQGGAYTEDNAKVFQIIQDMVAGTTFESSIKAHQRGRNGRGAYLSLCQHNMGSSKWDKILEDAETYVMKREWNGRNHRFSLRAHISRHREAHNEMTRAAQHVDYELPNDHTRVGRLIKSITSKEPAIVSAITHIQGSDTQRDDFELAAEFLLLMAPAQTNANQSHRISSVKNDKSKGKGKTGKDTGVELRYYTKREYSKLSHDERKELAELRRANNSNDSKNNASTKKTISALEQQVKDLEERLVAAINTQSSTDDTSTDTDDRSERAPLTNPLNQRN